MLDIIQKNWLVFLAVIVIGGLIVFGVMLDIYLRYGKEDKDDSYKHFKNRMKEKYEDPCDRIYD